MRHVGTDLVRPEGPAKVSGSALYVADLVVPGAWVGGCVRTDVACGELTGFERDPAFDFSRVVVVGPADIPGENVQALIVDDQPVLCARDVLHHGEPLLLVAAPDRATLHAALAAIRPKITPRTPLLDAELATHVFKSIAIDRGDVERVFAKPPAGARVFEGVYRTDSQEQLYIEPQGGIAWPPERDAGLPQRPHPSREARSAEQGRGRERSERGWASPVPEPAQKRDAEPDVAQARRPRRSSWAPKAPS